MMHPVDPPRLHVAHRYLADVAYPNDPQQQGRFLEALACAFGETIGVERRDVPLRVQETNGRLRKGHKRLKHALVAVHIAAAVVLEREVGLTLHAAAQDIALAIAAGKARAKKQDRAWSATTRGTDVLRRVWRPHASRVWLAVPLALARLSPRIKFAIYQRRPELLSFATPASFVDQALDDRWPYEAMEVAAMWRALLRSRGIIQ